MSSLDLDSLITMSCLHDNHSMLTQQISPMGSPASSMNSNAKVKSLETTYRSMTFEDSDSDSSPNLGSKLSFLNDQPVPSSKNPFEGNKSKVTMIVNIRDDASHACTLGPTRLAFIRAKRRPSD